jgi:glycosyltransferase involved in cell wall biosynthesis
LVQASNEIGAGQSVLAGRYFDEARVTLEAIFLVRRGFNLDLDGVVSHCIPLTKSTIRALEELGLLEVVYGFAVALKLLRMTCKKPYDVIAFDSCVPALIFRLLGGFRRTTIVLEDGGPLYEFMFVNGLNFRRYMELKVSEFCKRKVIDRVQGVVLKGSQQFASKMMRRFKISGRILVCAAGVDADIFKPAPKSVEERVRLRTPPLVLMVGGIEARKNQLSVVEAFPDILRSFPTAQLILLAKGRQPKYWREVVSKIRSLALSSHVLIDEPPENPYILAGYFRAADVFILASLGEGLSRALLMAMSTGTPILASEIPENLEVSSMQDEIVYFKPFDTSQISSGVVSLLRNGAKRAQAGRVTRDTVLRQYSLNRVAQLKTQFYSELATLGQLDRFKRTRKS